ncbi:MAG: hypothetical protein LBI67_11665 [Treponema sp.]|jgi:outer membrane protein OmpA-like peptidoglycan-associated protein|nr:hypothetical protein [Treponema sp.]
MRNSPENGNFPPPPTPDRFTRNYLLKSASPFSFFLLFLFGFGAAPLCAAADWKDALFLDLGAQYYVVPDFAGSLSPDMAERYGVSGGLIKPLPGFRAGAGCEWRKFRFSLETGCTYIKGDNPLVLNLTLLPLIVRAGYVFSPWKELTVIPMLGAGVVFTGVNHYETAIAMLLDRPSRSSNTGFLANAAVRLGWSFVPALTLYAGAGIDCVMETGGIIPLPSLELGVTVKPFAFRKKPRREPPAVVTVPAEPEPPAGILPPEPSAEMEPAVAEPVAVEPAPVVAVPVEPEPPAGILPPEPSAEMEPAFAEPVAVEPPPVVAVPEPLPVEAPARIVRILHFPANAALPVRSHVIELDAAGELLAADAALGVTLVGYTAPYGTGEGRLALSQARARFCADYLVREYGIEAERVHIEWYGAERLPPVPNSGAGVEDWRRRCVEIVIEPMEERR